MTEPATVAATGLLCEPTLVGTPMDQWTHLAVCVFEPMDGELGIRCLCGVELPGDGWPLDDVLCAIAPSEVDPEFCCWAARAYLEALPR
jgi:hypothetical protein